MLVFSRALKDYVEAWFSTPSSTVPSTKKGGAQPTSTGGEKYQPLTAEQMRFLNRHWALAERKLVGLYWSDQILVITALVAPSLLLSIGSH